MSDLLMPMPIQYEPKKKNRFFLRFPDDMIDVWKVQTVGAPTIDQNSVPIEYLNTKTYVVGKFEWQPIDITFLDPIGPSTAQQLIEWIRLHSESITGRQGYAAGYMKTITLTPVDPTGVEVSKWLLQNCLVTNFQADSFDQGDDGLIMPSITVQPQRCLLLY